MKVKQSCQNCLHNGKDDVYGTQEFPKFDKCRLCVISYDEDYWTTLSKWKPREVVSDYNNRH